MRDGNVTHFKMNGTGEPELVLKGGTITLLNHNSPKITLMWHFEVSCELQCGENETNNAHVLELCA